MSISLAPRYECFLCHNSRDKPLVREICQALRHDFGIEAFIDESSLVGGDDWNRAIQAALAASRTCGIFVGANGWGEYQLAHEAQPALARYRADPSFRVVPVPLPGATAASMDELGDLFHSQQRVDFRDADLGSAIRTLAKAIRGENAIPEGPTALTEMRVRFDAERWELANRRDSSVLYRGNRLREAFGLRASRPSKFGASAQLFLDASARAQRDELGRHLGAHAAVLVQDRGTRELAAQLAVEAVARCPSAAAHAALTSLRTLLPQQVAELSFTAPVTAATSSPAGRLRIALGCADGKVALFDGAALTLARWEHGATVRSAEFDLDGNCLATGGDDGSIVVWDLDRWEPRLRLALSGRIERLQIRGTGDRKLLMACSGGAGQTGKAALWTLPDGNLVAGAWATMIAMSAALDAAAARLLVAWGDHVALIDTESGKLLGHAAAGSGVLAVDVHPVLPLAAALTFDRRLWTFRIDGDPQLEMQPFAEGISPASTPRFGPAGRWLGVLGDDFRVRAWETSTGRLQTIPYEGLVGVEFGFGPRGERLWVVSPERKTISVWQLGTASEVCSLRVDSPTVALFDDSEQLVLAASDGNKAKIFRLPEADPARWSRGLGYPWRIAFGRARRHLAWFGRTVGADMRVGPPTLAVLALDTGATLFSASLPDGDAADATIQLCFDASEVLLAVERKGIWQVWSLDGSSGTPVARQPDWALTAPTADASAALQIEPIAAACQRRGGHANAVASADGRWLAINHHGRQVSVWDLDDNEEQTCFSTAAEVATIVFDPAGRLVAVGDEYGCISVRCTDGTMCAEFRHAEPIAQLAFTPDGTLLAAASVDGALRLWIVAPELLAAEVRARLAGPLSADARLRYLGDEFAVDVVDG